VDLVGLGKKNEVTQDIVKENTDDIERKVENSTQDMGKNNTDDIERKVENSNLTKEEGKIFQHPEWKEKKDQICFQTGKNWIQAFKAYL